MTGLENEPNHNPPSVNREGSKVEHHRKDGLDDRDDQSSVDYELGQACAPVVRIAPMPHCKRGKDVA